MPWNYNRVNDRNAASEDIELGNKTITNEDNKYRDPDTKLGTQNDLGSTASIADYTIKTGERSLQFQTLFSRPQPYATELKNLGNSWNP